MSKIQFFYKLINWIIDGNEHWGTIQVFSACQFSSLLLHSRKTAIVWYNNDIKLLPNSADVLSCRCASPPSLNWSEIPKHTQHTTGEFTTEGHMYNCEDSCKWTVVQLAASPWHQELSPGAFTHQWLWCLASQWRVWMVNEMEYFLLK